jgi:histidinol phosphatase-like PHP family hydrolase
MTMQEGQHKINLHNHTTWSDGTYPPEQLARMAVLGGLTHLGISDHFFTYKLAHVRAFVDVDQIENYVTAIRELATRFAARLQILVGLEVDWTPPTERKLSALWSKVNQFDYVLFEYVQDEEMGGNSLSSLLAVRPLIHVPVGLAHNHLARNFLPAWSPQELATTLQEHDVFVELSTAPETCTYRNVEPEDVAVWQALAEAGVRFSVGSDAHHSIEQVADVQDAHDFLAERGLLDRLITASWEPVLRTWRDRWRT